MRERLRRWGRFALPVLIAVAIPVLLARCTPQWLPDSKRFVYLAGNGTVQLYDIEAKRSRRIAQLKFPMAGIAVWPTGDRVAVVHLPEKDKPKLQVTVYDLEGNELHASPIHQTELDGKGAAEFIMMLSTSVSPDGKHIVAFPPGGGGAITYNMETKKFQEYRDLASIGLLAGVIASKSDVDRKYVPMGFDVSAATPDGKGFIAIRQSGGGGFVFIPWGEEEPVDIKFSDRQRKAMEAAVDDKSKGPGVATIPRWDGGTLKMHIDGGTLSIDHGMRSTTYESDMRSDVLLQHAKKQEAIVVCHFASGAILQIKEKQLQLWLRGADTVALTEQREEGGILALSVSPDAEKVLVRSIANGKDFLEVYNLRGERLAQLEHASLVP